METVNYYNFFFFLTNLNLDIVDMMCKKQTPVVVQHEIILLQTEKMFVSLLAAFLTEAAG